MMRGVYMFDGHEEFLKSGMSALMFIANSSFLIIRERNIA